MRRFLFRTLLILSVSLVAISGFSPTAGAASWLSNAEFDTMPLPDNFEERDCSKGTLSVVDSRIEAFESILDTYGCVYNAKDFSVAEYTEGTTYRWGIKQNGDSYYRRIADLQQEARVFISPDSNRFTYYAYQGSTGSYTNLTTLYDLAQDLQPIAKTPLGQTTLYAVNENTSYRWFKYSYNGAKVNAQTYSFGQSPNGKYGLAYINFKGIVKINFETREVTAVMRAFDRNPSMFSVRAGTITNDGKTGFISGIEAISTFNCGYELTPQLIESDEYFKNTDSDCPRTLYYNNIFEKTKFNGLAREYKWLKDNEVLQFSLHPTPGSADLLNFRPVLVTMRMDGSSSIAKLDYLAMGDSYSSGEGDIDTKSGGVSFYTQSTAQKGGCHLSTRSYPFLLAQINGLNIGRAQSVACSGAIVSKDYYGSSDNYLGQSRQLKGKSIDEQTKARSTALASFTPGVIKQLDFVREYKPRVVTLTGGGNDVGFAKVLGACASQDSPGVCAYAKQGSKLNRTLGSAIAARYDDTLRLIAEIKSASPTTSIYIVGYPSFVSEGATCLNGAALLPDERKMINQGVNYLNKILEAAAKKAGANYVNIEDSLVGGRICEGSKYMTGVTKALHKDRQEWFHPNAEGHKMMADAIMGANFKIVANNNPSPVESTEQPATPAFFAGKKYKKARLESIVSSDTATRGTAVGLNVQTGAFKAKSKVVVSIDSEEKAPSMGVSDKEGSYSAVVNVPRTLDLDYHTLLLEGESPEGEPIVLYQIIDVIN